MNRLSMRPPHVNPILKDSFSKTSTNRISRERQKIPHSSFYLHQLNNQRPISRDTKNMSILNESVNEIGTRSSGTGASHNHRVRRIQTGANRKDILQEMREFTQARINSSGGKQISRSFK